MTSGEARIVIEEGLLPALSRQAGALQRFFADSTGDPIATLKSAEYDIANKVASTTPADYLATVDGKRAGAIGFITPEESADFATLFEGYRAGNYLTTRDWRTVDGAYDADARDKFVDATEVAGASGPAEVGPGKSFEVYGVAISGMGDPADAFHAIEYKLVELGVEALEAKGITGGRAEDLVRALIRQFGQDTEEFRAFYDSIKAMGFASAERTYNVTPATTVASAPLGAQSVRLASVGATFAPGLVKGATGKRKDGAEMV